ncbi:hypothetical protein ACN95_00510 [Gordonia sihwensis]|uniref:hypothetical protein n=1 Tax=Gordonia sihwensis TaxID=173559 RepID=UPI001C92D239|nr:hypothetical protein [Gordonia sihwensis]MBY4568506.1 hypothetical protein [Gordonia sihwensis]
MPAKSTSSLVEKTFATVAGLRHGRAVHRHGLVCAGDATIEAEQLPLASGPTVVRISKGLGTPAGLPDLVGVALRLPTGDTDDVGEPRHWDLLLSGPVRRIGVVDVPTPTATWNDLEVSTISPFAWKGEHWTVSARLLAPHVLGGLDLASLADALQAGGGLSLEARRTDHRTPLGFVDLTRVGVDPDVAFDPVDTMPSGVDQVPAWLGSLRRNAYRGSRRGRPAPPTSRSA